MEHQKPKLVTSLIPTSRNVDTLLFLELIVKRLEDEKIDTIYYK